MNESCHTCEWVMSHICMHLGGASCGLGHHSRYLISQHIWVTYDIILDVTPSHTYESYGWVIMSQNRSSHHVILDIRPSQEWVMTQIWIHTCGFSCIKIGRHITLLSILDLPRNESWHTHKFIRVASHVWMLHGTHRNESWYTCEYGIARILMSHGTHRNESWRTYAHVMANIEISHGTNVNTVQHT